MLRVVASKEDTLPLDVLPDCAIVDRKIFRSGISVEIRAASMVTGFAPNLISGSDSCNNGPVRFNMGKLHCRYLFQAIMRDIGRRDGVILYGQRLSYCPSGPIIGRGDKRLIDLLDRHFTTQHTVTSQLSVLRDKYEIHTYHAPATRPSSSRTSRSFFFPFTTPLPISDCSSFILLPFPIPASLTTVLVRQSA